ncbi:ketoacyl-ACP synthase III family protein [Actinophytocola oryzae]|uniref:3-oxoacyl-[acyl-carrier-protein] synthase-3 n=1 Tax=Actinophytocola oryzae TaxID=502181 RepID=A0A4R7VKN6_9PSEU|nr:ketoacyl-ACP synthase III family protein [Actinophytocola oryzae]TDV49768.1 3-oxoacyl-[acyl-carrier-protein] synthase-3 [Actinophytocola oryzae]
MRLADIYLDSIGVHLPTPVEVRDAVADGHYEAELMAETGFTRTYVGAGVSALDMAVAAGRQAMARASVDRASVGYLVHGGAYYQGPPGWSATGYLMRGIGLGQAPSVQVAQECNGMLTGLELAIGQLTGAAEREAVLVTSAANYATPLVDRWHQAGPQSVLSDGAAAMVVTRKHGFAEVLSVNSRTMPEVEGWARGTATLMPPTATDDWSLDLVRRAVDHSQATGVPMQDWLDDLADHCRSLASRSLADAKLEISDIRRLITFHTARYAYEESIGDTLGVPVERSNWEVGRSVGHIGPCDHVVSLELLLGAGELRPGDHVLLVSWGSGMTATTAVLRILELPSWTEGTEVPA